MERGNDRAEAIILAFTVPRTRPLEPTTVTRIYPSAGRLPENQLKFYIHFSAPPRRHYGRRGRGEAYRRIHLLDAEGQVLEAVFLELGEELWDPPMQRFTLLCDPGRVKRGLKPREELGPVLRSGNDYTLVVDDDWLDANGRKLTAGMRKTFHVVAADDAPIDPATWRIDCPRAGTREPLTVRFGEPLDHALVTRMLSVAGAEGDTIAGTIEITDGETCWTFRPERPWPAGDFRLSVNTALEDLAGNAIGRAFDVDVQGPVQQRVDSDVVSLPFATAAAKSP